MLIRAILALAFLCPIAGHAADKSSALFCALAKAHRDQYQTDKAAEDAAIAQGASRATIAKAKRCPR